jgi:hypothetical protein
MLTKRYYQYYPDCPRLFWGNELTRRFEPLEATYYHCVARCVRRAFPMR